MANEENEEIKIIKGPLPTNEMPTEYETYYRFFEKYTTIKMIKE